LSELSAVFVSRIQQRILFIRGEKVLLDADLADFYGVSTKVLNQSIRRNIDRFPADFMFRLTKSEKREVVTNCDHLNRLKYSPVNPIVFTEHGAMMVACILNSPRAVGTSLFIVRAFVELRRLSGTHKELAEKITLLEKNLTKHDQQILALVDAIKKIIDPVKPARTMRIGFRAND
jgi:hypothetical protein